LAASVTLKKASRKVASANAGQLNEKGSQQAG